MQYLSFYCLLYSFFKCRNTFIIKLTHVYNNNVNVCGSCVVVRRPALLWTPAEAFPGKNLRLPSQYTAHILSGFILVFKYKTMNNLQRYSI